MKRLVPFALVALLLASCTSEVARMNFTQVSTQDQIFADSVMLHLTPDKDLDLWAEMDVEYTGNGQMAFVMEVSKGDSLMGTFAMDPRECTETTSSYHVTLGNSTEMSQTGKMNFLYVDDAADYKVRAYFVAEGFQELKLEEMALVLKQ